ETGIISFVQNGKITRNLDSSRLRALLIHSLEPQKVGGRSTTPDRIFTELDKSITPVPKNSKRQVLDPQAFVTKD
ncbi:MAG: hypothetical protein JNN15_09605, partial [Blastocatellia bacterium]|nr:hypothetical protein [Blastocatellia bacterium]